MSSDSDWDKSSDDEDSPAPPPKPARNDSAPKPARGRGGSRGGGRGRGRGRGRARGRRQNDDSSGDDEDVVDNRRSDAPEQTRADTSERPPGHVQQPGRGELRPFWTREDIEYQKNVFDIDPDFAQNEATCDRGQRESHEDYCERIRADIDLGLYSPELVKYGLSLYETFVPIYENVADDNHRPFLVDLDSLVIDLLQSPVIDTAHGIQSLPVIFLLESRLNLFCNGGRKVHIVCFDVCKSLYASPQYNLVREIAVAHLKNMTKRQREQHEAYLTQHASVEEQVDADDGKAMEGDVIRDEHSYDLVIEFYQFENWWSEKFSDHIYQYLPVFMLVARPDYSPIVRPDCRYLFVFMSLYLLAMEIPVVLSSEITYRSNAMYGFTLDVPKSVHRHIIRTFRRQLTTTSEVDHSVEVNRPETATEDEDAVVLDRELNIGHSLSVVPLADPPTFDGMMGVAQKQEVFALLDKMRSDGNYCDDVRWEGTGQTDARQMLSLFACAQMLQENNEISNMDFARLVTLTLLFLKELPIESRTFRLPVLEEEKAYAVQMQIDAEQEDEKEMVEEEAPVPVEEEQPPPPAEEPTSMWADMDDSDDDGFFDNVPDVVIQKKKKKPKKKKTTPAQPAPEAVSDNVSEASSAAVVRMAEAPATEAQQDNFDIASRPIVLSRRPKSRPPI